MRASDAPTSATRSTGVNREAAVRFDRSGRAGGGWPPRRRTGRCRRRRMANSVVDSSARAAPAAGTVSSGGSATAANGRPAASRTTTTIAWSRSQPGSPTTTPMTPGRPSWTSHPATSASTPPAIAAGTMGTTTRLTAGATSDSRPNVARTSGSVAACAARLIPSASASHPGMRPPHSAAIQRPSGVAQASSPAVASTERRNPASPIIAGSTSSSPAAASERAAGARTDRPDSRASRTTPAISAARTTDGDAPAATTYAATTAAVAAPAARFDARPRRSAATSAPTIAMFQPEIATTWLTPAVAKSAASWRSTRSRRPIRIPAASPASGSGRTRRRASPAASRMPWIEGAGARLRISTDSARSVPDAPIRRR